LVEHRIRNAGVVGSNPINSTILIFNIHARLMFMPKENKAKTVVNKKGASLGNSGTKKPWTFPKSTLEDSIKILKAIEEKHGGNPMDAKDLAKAVGFNMPTDWRFLDLLKSANLYGLVDGSGKQATVTIEKLGRDIIAPSSPSERQNALLKAFTNVEDFNAVLDFYGDKKIPEDEFFLNTLNRKFNISRDRVEDFSKIFFANIQYVKAFEPVKDRQDNSVILLKPKKVSAENQVEKSERIFLDTCFVMMPFGGWYDRYYQEIFVPAIKDAGFEPVRVDELFSTGSVVEQIWEQISKASVLLADLSDKNPNVFYELGLAHAAKKPVVFTASKLEDVPFDLRHLRVIVYEIREPGWAQKLKEHITNYVKNAAKDPAKSIPHPFRAELISDQDIDVA
jgi:hypothetical protein